jgi:hypothetical protein
MEPMVKLAQNEATVRKSVAMTKGRLRSCSVSGACFSRSCCITVSAAATASLHRDQQEQRVNSTWNQWKRALLLVGFFFLLLVRVVEARRIANQVTVKLLSQSHLRRRGLVAQTTLKVVRLYTHTHERRE